MYYTYILKSKKRSHLYIGYSKNIKRRLRRHNQGKCSSSKRYAPYELIYYEAFIHRKDAKNREKYLKSGWGRKSLKNLLAYYLEEKSIN